MCSVLNLEKVLVFDYGSTIKLTSFGPYFKTAVQIFSLMDLIILQ